ncbi:MAG: hypothetical protein KGJ84_03305 [Elusimicrobia bacterium]|nr:hypothetical protein [Elusimicrobiota bacterium]
MVLAVAVIAAGYFWRGRQSSQTSPLDASRKCLESCQAECKLWIDDPCTTASERFGACLSACRSKPRLTAP